MSEELVPVKSQTWLQDGLRIERVEARLAGTVGVIDDDAGAMTLGSTGVLVGRYRIYDVAAKEDKRSGDVFRKVVLEVGEVRVVHDYLERKKLLVDLGFEDTGDVIAATASPALPPAGVDPDTGEVASDLEELESVDG